MPHSIRATGTDGSSPITKSRTTVTEQTQPKTRPPDTLIITVESSPEKIQDGHHVLSFYVERFWTPILGPTSVMVLRRVVHESVSRDATTFALDQKLLFRSIGVTGSSAARRVLARLEMFRHVTRQSDDRFCFSTHLAPLHRGQIARLHPVQQREHERFLEQHASTAVRA